MAKISLTPRFLIDSVKVIFQKSPKAFLFGERALLSGDEQQIVTQTVTSFTDGSATGRSGAFSKIDVVHKGSGMAYLVADPNDANKSLLVLGEDFSVTQGPDLYPYLLTSDNAKESLGEYLNLGDLRANKGAQTYSIDKPLAELDQYKTAAIYCKQFSVLFSFASLS